MKQEGYLDAQGQPIVKQPVDPVKLARKISIIALVVLIVKNRTNGKILDENLQRI